MFIQSYSSERKQLLICMSLGSLSRLLFKSYHLSAAHKEEAFIGSPSICSSCRTLNLNLFLLPTSIPQIQNHFKIDSVLCQFVEEKGNRLNTRAPKQTNAASSPSSNIENSRMIN